MELTAQGLPRNRTASTLTFHCVHQLIQLPLSKNIEFIFRHRSPEKVS